VSSRQLAEHRAQQRFTANMRALHLELAESSPPTARRHLDVLVELLETLLPFCGQSVLTAAYRAELSEIRLRVAVRHNLRLIQGSKTQ